MKKLEGFIAAVIMIGMLLSSSEADKQSEKVLEPVSGNAPTVHDYQTVVGHVE